MKKNRISKTALACLIIGLFATSLTPIINRYFLMPDALKGFIMGMGLMFEVIAIIKIQRSKNELRCSKL